MTKRFLSQLRAFEMAASWRPRAGPPPCRGMMPSTSSAAAPTSPPAADARPRGESLYEVECGVGVEDTGD